MKISADFHLLWVRVVSCQCLIFLNQYSCAESLDNVNLMTASRGPMGLICSNVLWLNFLLHLKIIFSNRTVVWFISTASTEYSCTGNIQSITWKSLRSVRASGPEGKFFMSGSSTINKIIDVNFSLFTFLETTFSHSSDTALWPAVLFRQSVCRSTT